MMTWINVHLDCDADVHDRRALAMMRAEMEFWRDHARRLQETLENVYARAEAGEPTELWRDGVKIVVVPKEDAA